MEFAQRYSASVGFLLFAAGIVGFSLMLQITTAQLNPDTCWMEGTNRVATDYHPVSGNGTNAKCNAVLRECADLCNRRGEIVKWDVCKWRSNNQVYACTACCLPPPPPPPSPSPPPPSPPPPPQCGYRSFGTTDCSVCEEYCNTVCTHFEHVPGTSIRCRSTYSGAMICDCCCHTGSAATGSMIKVFDKSTI